VFFKKYRALTNSPPLARCHTLISSRDYHSPTFLFSLAELSCSTLVDAQDERLFDVSVKNAENAQMRGQKGHFKAFSDPWLAQASL